MMHHLDIFWTGGLDSSYRVLELILIEKRKIKPHYIIDSSRSSTLHEINAMEKIKLMLKIQGVDTSRLLLPLNLISKADIKPNEKITGWYENLKKQLRIGIQYEWLARFAYEYDLNEIELCLERDPEGKESDFDRLLSNSFNGIGHECKLKDFTNPDLRLFENFRLPIFHFTKIELKQRARRYGFDDILRHIWFCHNPTPKGLLCGSCRPCRIFKESGLKDSYTFDSDLMINRLKDKVKNAVKSIYSALRSGPIQRN